MERFEKRLRLVEKTKAGSLGYKYILADEENNQYIWLTGKEYFFEKKQWRNVNFKILDSIEEYTRIHHCRISKAE